MLPYWGFGKIGAKDVLDAAVHPTEARHQPIYCHTAESNHVRRGHAMHASLLRLRSLKTYVVLIPVIAGLALSHTAMMVAGFSGLSNGPGALRSGLGTCIAATPHSLPWGCCIERAARFPKKPSMLPSSSPSSRKAPPSWRLDSLPSTGPVRL